MANRLNLQIIYLSDKEIELYHEDSWSGNDKVFRVRDGKLYEVILNDDENPEGEDKQHEISPSGFQKTLRLIGIQNNLRILEKAGEFLRQPYGVLNAVASRIYQVEGDGIYTKDREATLDNEKVIVAGQYTFLDMQEKNCLYYLVHKMENGILKYALRPEGEITF
jgi:hypothetical protein